MARRVLGVDARGRVAGRRDARVSRAASRVKEVAKAGRALHKVQIGNDLTFEIFAVFAKARAIERAESERARE